MTTIGDTDVKPTFRIVKWKIKEFFKLSEVAYSSSIFTYANAPCYLMIYPNGNKEDSSYTDGYISVYAGKKCNYRTPPIEIEFSLKTLNKKKVFDSHRTYVLEYTAEGGVSNFLLRSDLFKRKTELMPSDTLTIVCILKCRKLTEDAFGAKGNQNGTSNESELSSDEEDDAKEKVSSKIKGIQILSENLKQMLLDGLMSDAVLKVDSQEFNVHKFILAARSPVFAAMFQHDLAEKNTNEVDIPDCTAESFEVFLHYLYSGNIETLSTSNVHNVYYAADKYQIIDLKKKCVKFMLKNITVETFCDMIALSLRHGESKLQKNATDFFCRNIAKIIKTVEWMKYMEANTTQANELLIKALHA